MQPTVTGPARHRQLGGTSLSHSETCRTSDLLTCPLRTRRAVRAQPGVRRAVTRRRGRGEIGRLWHYGRVTDSATVILRLPLTSLIGVFWLAMGITPVALAVPGLQVLYLLPLALAVWLVRTRTVAGPETVVAYRVWGRRQITWLDLSGLRIDDRSRVWAMLRDGEQVLLPVARARDLPVLAAISGGRLPNPLSQASEPPASEKQQ